MGTQNAGYAVLAGLATGTDAQTVFTYLAYSESTTAHNATHTTIQGTESQRESATCSRVTTTQTNDTAQLYKQFTISSTEVIGCCGVFNASSAGVMGYRTVLDSVRNVKNGDTWSCYYKIKFA